MTMRRRNSSMVVTLAIIVMMVVVPILTFPRQAAASPMLSVSPASGLPGTSVVLTGSGFEPNRAIALFFAADGHVPSSV